MSGRSQPTTRRTGTPVLLFAALALLAAACSPAAASNSRTQTAPPPIGEEGIIWSCVDTATGAIQIVNPPTVENPDPCDPDTQQLLWWQQSAPQGPPGDQGPQGDEGPKGDTGSQGATGARGSQGSSGSRGAQGATGPAGPAGAAGPPGAAGPVGPPGAVGPLGPQGLEGAIEDNACIVTSNIDGTSTLSCPDGSTAEIGGVKLGTFEICDSLDNDQDGEVDEELGSYCIRGVVALNTDGDSSCLPEAIDRDGDPGNGCEVFRLPGDTAANAIELDPEGSSNVGDTTHREDHYSIPPGVCPIGPSDVYLGIGTPDQVFRLDADESSGYRLWLRSGFVGSVYVVEDVNDLAGSCIGSALSTSEVVPATLNFGATAGRPVYIIVDGFDELVRPNNGEFILNVAPL